MRIEYVEQRRRLSNWVRFQTVNIWKRLTFLSVSMKKLVFEIWRPPGGQLVTSDENWIIRPSRETLPFILDSIPDCKHMKTSYLPISVDEKVYCYYACFWCPQNRSWIHPLVVRKPQPSLTRYSDTWRGRLLLDIGNQNSTINYFIGDS